MLSEETVAHEHEVLTHLRQQGFPAPLMIEDQQGRAWVNVEDRTYSFYAFVKGYRPVDFWWWPSQQRAILRQIGYTLAELHRATLGLEPTHFKWDAYRPRTSSLHTSGASTTPESRGQFAAHDPDQLAQVSGSRRTRWRDSTLYRQAFSEIRPLVNKASATSPVDEFARSHIDDLERLIELEPDIEARPGLCRVVIHGDYAPWNILRCPDHSIFVLDFNAARLDLRIYDVMLASFWFAWQRDHMDIDTAIALQTGYWDGCSQQNLDSGELVQTIHAPSQTEIDAAPNVFCWLMGRSIAERLRSHYLEQRFLLADPSSIERHYRMCVWARQHPKQLTQGLRCAQKSI
jgi:Ser/Thr protein kinase RdoA (MazF antagonist)